MNVQTLPTTQLVSVEPDDARKKAQIDFNFLALLAAPEAFVFAFPAFYLACFVLLTAFKKPYEYFALGIPRGFAKTTFVKILCLWYILFSSKRFILVICASEDKAINIVADIMMMLSGENMRRLFGSWQANVAEDSKTKKVFYFRGRNIIVQGIGIWSDIRGVNRNNDRPDVMILDDVQSKEVAKDIEQTHELLEHITGTVLKTKSNFGCTFIFIANMYPENSILAKLQENPIWTSLIVGGILEDGTSLWEDLKPLETLLEEWESDTSLGMGHVFESEVLNKQGRTEFTGIDITKIQTMPEWMDLNDAEGGFILIDPSGAKKTSDDCTIEHFSVIDGKPIFDEIVLGVFTPLETIDNALKLGIKRNTRLICVESVAYQASLLFWFNYICEQRGISGFTFMPVSPRNQAKNLRIKRGALKLINGEMYLHPSVRSLYIDQISRWDPNTTDNTDDIIDPPGYVDEVIQLYGTHISKILVPVDDSVEAAHSDTIQTLF